MILLKFAEYDDSLYLSFHWHGSMSNGWSNSSQLLPWHSRVVRVCVQKPLGAVSRRSPAVCRRRSRRDNIVFADRAINYSCGDRTHTITQHVVCTGYKRNLFCNPPAVNWRLQTWRKYGLTIQFRYCRISHNIPVHLNKGSCRKILNV